MHSFPDVRQLQRICSGITSQSTSNVIVSSIPSRSACEKLELERYCSDVAGATSAVMRKVGGGGFCHEKKANILLKMLDMVYFVSVTDEAWTELGCNLDVVVE